MMIFCSMKYFTFLYHYSTMNKTIWSVRLLGLNIISFLPLYYVFVVMKVSIINVLFVSSSSPQLKLWSKHYSLYEVK